MTKFKIFKPLVVLAVGLTLLMMKDSTLSTIGIVLFTLAMVELNEEL